MNEDLIKTIWKYGYFGGNHLRTTTGDTLVIEYPGQENFDAGPDFFMAKVRIAGQLWIGNVEIHTRSSDWNKHGHQGDAAYESIILHVVWNDDQPVHLSGDQVPTLELKNWVPDAMMAEYHRLMGASKKLGCAEHVSIADAFSVNRWLDRMFFERFEEKVQRMRNDLALTQNNMGEVLWRWTARYLGGPVNGHGFQQVAQTLSLSLLLKYHNRPHALAALLYGCAGLIDSKRLPDLPELQAQWRFLKVKHQLSVAQAPWKYMRMRPSAFPEQRMKLIIQFLLSFLPTLREPEAFFDHIKRHQYPSDFLNGFGDLIPSNPLLLSKHLNHHYLVNVLFPLLFIRGIIPQEEIWEHVNRIQPEDNQCTRFMTNNGFPNKQLIHSQALLHLHRNYCTPKKCTQCAIGLQMLGKPFAIGHLQRATA
ncbi:MAG TPA: DUF2851 family protein [Luteibaculaceae bacterium]|nr:DUF2851 family protein [Luteibaculaceae bacterium]